MKVRTEEGAVLYGINPILEALRKRGRRIEALYIQRGRGGRQIQEILQLGRDSEVNVSFETKEVVDRISGTTKHQGVVGRVSITPYSLLEEVLTRAGERSEPPFLFLLDGIEDPRNLGAIIRTGEAAGCHGIIIPQRRAAGLTATVAKVSAGAVEHLPVVRVVNLTGAIGELKREGVWVYALDAHAEKSYLEEDYRGPVALVIGGEGGGVGRTVRKMCDVSISIPLFGRISSLNASVAAGIVAYEVVRQRLTKRESR